MQLAIILAPAFYLIIFARRAHALPLPPPIKLPSFPYIPPGFGPGPVVFPENDLLHDDPILPIEKRQLGTESTGSGSDDGQPDTQPRDIQEKLSPVSNLAVNAHAC